jgi:hypothetical protein
MKLMTINLFDGDHGRTHSHRLRLPDGFVGLRYAVKEPFLRK